MWRLVSRVLMELVCVTLEWTTHHLFAALLEVGASVPEDFYFPDYEESTLLDGCNRPNFAYNKHSQAPPPVFQPVLALRAVPSRISLRCFLLQHPDCFVQNVDVTDVLMSASVPCCFVDRSVSRTSLTGDVLSRLKSRASQGQCP